MYKAKHVDTEKALKYIKELIYRYYQECEVEKQKVDKFYSGVQKGLDIAEEIFLRFLPPLPTDTRHRLRNVPAGAPQRRSVMKTTDFCSYAELPLPTADDHDVSGLLDD